jgi:hypothetical protein
MKEEAAIEALAKPCQWEREGQKKAESRKPKPETNPKSEVRNPKSKILKAILPVRRKSALRGAAGTCCFVLRTSTFGLRISDFGFRISDFPLPLPLAYAQLQCRN